ncbi:NlpC/P60 family protein [Streptomyces sp. NPDC001401]|uniref:NlpC/P60 family protein n=1 Tax=Streptomyces sp. NPDC001401 TaxID=3364570 RepID=UPI0036C61750
MARLKRVSLQRLQVGDIIAFGYRSSYADHVGLYAGHGLVIDTSSRCLGGVGRDSWIAHGRAPRQRPGHRDHDRVGERQHRHAGGQHREGHQYLRTEVVIGLSRQPDALA